MIIADKVLRAFRPDTEVLDLTFNPGLGHTGLKTLVQGMMEKEQSGWELKELSLGHCGIGSTGQY